MAKTAKSAMSCTSAMMLCGDWLNSSTDGPNLSRSVSVFGLSESERFITTDSYVVEYRLAVYLSSC